MRPKAMFYILVATAITMIGCGKGFEPAEALKAKNPILGKQAGNPLPGDLTGVGAELKRSLNEIFMAVNLQKNDSEALVLRTLVRLDDETAYEVVAEIPEVNSEAPTYSKIENVKAKNLLTEEEHQEFAAARFELTCRENCEQINVIIFLEGEEVFQKLGKAVSLDVLFVEIEGVYDIRSSLVEGLRGTRTGAFESALNDLKYEVDMSFAQNELVEMEESQKDDEDVLQPVEVSSDLRKADKAVVTESKKLDYTLPKEEFQLKEMPEFERMDALFESEEATEN